MTNILRKCCILQKPMQTCIRKNIFNATFRNKFPINQQTIVNKVYIPVLNNFKYFANKIEDISSPLNELSFNQISNETLDSLSEYFEEIIENSKHLENADVEYSDGVLTIKFGNSYGTYVINRQTPNLQIWLSSPKSGPKRYDFVIGHGWIYKHDNTPLHTLLNEEISKIVKQNVDFQKCDFGM